MKNRNTVFAKVNLIVLLFCMTFVNAQNIDINILRDINIDRNKNLDPTFKFVTNTAVPISISTPIIIYSVGLIKKDSSIKKQAVFLGETFLVNAFVTIALKHTIKRNRPFETYPDIDQAASSLGRSFPSGHTSLAFTTATSLSLAYPKWFVIAPSFVWASTVGYSRMHLGVHYPSDVLAGAVIGSGSAYLSYKVNKWINKKTYKKDNKGTDIQ
ncbi:phosphatase PAP2 family protein [Flavobacterium glaciei]|uniref:Membrane-associated phospholipid phosphatase n=1 Tax=Flavobacterium glaciei TaxID=386300 RepID=A0A562PKH9_9FLAO|nr:phosphatase PAP2 family protein [Flavobacterium glaciei]RDI50286.1 membrane-associated phospholipid phosphatase [Flavobacterium glaciei]TWI44536.1 membrane-associated phospholipid phosphatase [Flavobacterium glaciei]